MNNRRKLFRVEAMGRPAAAAGAVTGSDPFAEQRHRELLTELKAVRELVGKKSAQSRDDDTESNEPDEELGAEINHLKAEMHEAQKLKVELDAMYHAISQTKREIASLHSSSFNGQEMSRVTDELDEVVMGTEKATEQILAAVEVIDEDANNLVARLDGPDHDMAADIQEKVIGIYEACNFQDITGQRITKVVNALRFVEERVENMMEIWGGIDSFHEVEVEDGKDPNCDSRLLNGPAQSSDEDVASQDDIDALFA